MPSISRGQRGPRVPKVANKNRERRNRERLCYMGAGVIAAATAIMAASVLLSKGATTVSKGATIVGPCVDTSPPNIELFPLSTKCQFAQYACEDLALELNLTSVFCTQLCSRVSRLSSPPCFSRGSDLETDLSGYIEGGLSANNVIELESSAPVPTVPNELELIVKDAKKEHKQTLLLMKIEGGPRLTKSIYPGVKSVEGFRKIRAVSFPFFKAFPGEDGSLFTPGQEDSHFYFRTDVLDTKMMSVWSQRMEANKNKIELGEHAWAQRAMLLQDKASVDKPLDRGQLEKHYNEIAATAALLLLLCGSDPKNAVQYAAAQNIAVSRYSVDNAPDESYPSVQIWGGIFWSVAMQKIIYRLCERSTDGISFKMRYRGINNLTNSEKGCVINKLNFKNRYTKKVVFYYTAGWDSNGNPDTARGYVYYPVMHDGDSGAATKG